jgi:hypothetical protein
MNDGSEKGAALAGGSDVEPRGLCTDRGNARALNLALQRRSKLDQIIGRTDGRTWTKFLWSWNSFMFEL